MEKPCRGPICFGLHPLLCYNPRMKIIYRERTWELPGRMTIRDAIRKVGLHPEAVLAFHEGKLVTDETIVPAGDTVKLIAVVSGG